MIYAQYLNRASRRFGELPVAVRALLLAGVAAVFGLMCGRVAASNYGPKVIELLVGVPVLIAIARRPLLAWIAVLAILATVFAYDHLPSANLPGHIPLNLGDWVLLAAIGGTVWRRPWRTWPAPLRWFVLIVGAVLLLASISGVQIATMNRSGLHWAIYGSKDFLYLLVAATLTLELSGKLWRPMLVVAVTVAALASVLSIAADASPTFSHFVVHHFAPTAATSASATFAAGGQSVATTAKRIRLPGLFFAYAMLLPTLVLAISLRGRWRTAMIVAVALILVAVGLSLNRNMYGGVLAGLLVTILLAGPRLRYRFVLVVAAAATTVTILVLTSVLPGFTKEIATRASSALSVNQVLNSGSAQTRGVEFSHAFASISHHPLSGVGEGQVYGIDQNLGALIGVENLPIDLATNYGIPAAIVFLLLPGFAIAYGIRCARLAARPLDRGLVSAGVGMTVAVVLSTLVGTYGQDPGTMLPIGIACGFVLAAGLRATRPADAPPDGPADVPPSTAEALPVTAA